MSNYDFSRYPATLALLLILSTCNLNQAHAGPWTTRVIDDFESGSFAPWSPMNWVQTGLPLESCWASRREITVNNTRPIVAELAGSNFDDELEIDFESGPPPDLPDTMQEVLRLEYLFGTTRDLTGGGAYDRIRIRLENVFAVRFRVEIGLKANTYPDVVFRGQGWFGVTAPPRDVDYEFLLSEYFPAINPTYVEAITVTVQTETFNSGGFRVAHIDLAGPVVAGQVENPDGGTPTASIHNATYFEEWSWPDLPGPGPVTAMLNVELVEDDQTAGGEYPGWISWGDDGETDPFVPGNLSHASLAADAINPYPDGRFEFNFRWADEGTGLRMFYPPDPIKILSSTSVVLRVNSHHLNFGSGRETQLIHTVRLDIPEGSPLIFSDVYELYNADDEFSLHFEVVNIDSSVPAGPPVFMMAHTADAGPYDVSTDAPQWTAADGPTLTATPSVTDGRTRIALSQPLAFASTVQVFDLRGRLVRRIALAAGREQVVWSGRDDSGQRLASGVYFARVEGAPSPAEKITLLR